jgi:hypothetical protein
MARSQHEVFTMSSISAVSGASAASAMQAAHLASPAPKPVDRDGDHDNNRPDAPAPPVKVGTTPVSKLDIEA